MERGRSLFWVVQLLLSDTPPFRVLGTAMSAYVKRRYRWRRRGQMWHSTILMRQTDLLYMRQCRAPSYFNPKLRSEVSPRSIPLHEHLRMVQNTKSQW
jgi:hypothetical protein